MNALDFCPAAPGNWDFCEWATLGPDHPVELGVTTTPSAGGTHRRIDIELPPELPRTRSLLTGFDATAENISLRSFHQAGREVTLAPPLDITFDDQVNSCPEFFPGFGMIGMAQPPYRCVTVQKAILEEETGGGLTRKLWEIGLRVTGKNGIVVLRADLTFGNNVGLWQYQGGFYGVTFVWRRHQSHPDGALGL